MDCDVCASDDTDSNRAGKVEGGNILEGKIGGNRYGDGVVLGGAIRRGDCISPWAGEVVGCHAADLNRGPDFDGSAGGGRKAHEGTHSFQERMSAMALPVITPTAAGLAKL